MAFPIYKILIVGFKTVSRPLNSMLIKALKSRGNFTTLFRQFGQLAHRYEIRLNQFIIKDDNAIGKKNGNSNLKVFIKPLSDDAAFNKGVEYFSEVFFFYGILIGLGIYEVRRNYISSEKQKEKLEQYEHDIETSKEDLKAIRAELEDLNRSRAFHF